MSYLKGKITLCKMLLLTFCLLGFVALMNFRVRYLRVVAEFPETDQYRKVAEMYKLIETDSAGVYMYLGERLSGVSEIGSRYHVYFSNCEENFVITSSLGIFLNGDDWERVTFMPCTRLRGQVKIGTISEWIQ